MSDSTLDLKLFIRDIPDFPKPGILFRDITPLLASPVALRETVRRMAEPFRDKKIHAVVAAEARGFIFAAPMAIELNAGFVPVRNPGKLPFDRHSFRYDLEYGSATTSSRGSMWTAGGVGGASRSSAKERAPGAVPNTTSSPTSARSSASAVSTTT